MKEGRKADDMKDDDSKSEDVKKAGEVKEAEEEKEADVVKDDESVKMSEDGERAENVKKAVLAETQKLEWLSEIIYQQNQTLLTAREGILLGRDRTRLYTAHKFRLGQVCPQSKAIFQGAQYDARQRLAYQARQKDILDRAVFKNVSSAARQVHKTLVEAVENLAPGGV